MACCEFPLVPDPSSNLSPEQRNFATTLCNISREALRDCELFCTLRRASVFFAVVLLLLFLAVWVANTTPESFGNSAADGLLRKLADLDSDLAFEVLAVFVSVSCAFFIVERRWHGIGQDAYRYDPTIVGQAEIDELRGKRERASLLPSFGG